MAGPAKRTPAWALTRWLAGHGPASLVAPGDTYGPAGVRPMCVSRSCRPDDRLELVARRLHATRLS